MKDSMETQEAAPQDGGAGIPFDCAQGRPMPATAGVGTPAVRQEGQVEAEAQPPSEGAEIATPAEADELRSQIAELEEQLKETRDRYLRALADLDNARKRARQEIAEAQVQGAAGVLRDVLTVVDSLERALETAEPGKKPSAGIKAVYDGVNLIHRQLLDMLARRGVRPIAAIGKPFDTGRHEAVAQVPVTASQEEGAVAAELQKGYLFGDRVLRPSRVAVTIWRPVAEKKPQAPA